MAFADALLVLTTYPEPTSERSVEQAVALGGQLGTGLSALGLSIELPVPGRANFLANLVVDVPAIAAAANEQSRAHATRLLDLFEQRATAIGAFRERFIETCESSQVPDVIVDHARLKDLTILPLGAAGGIESWYAEAVIFGSGRPVMVLPGPAEHDRAPSLQSVVIAWDFSRPAARAVADALPVLKRAQRVRAVQVTREKPITTTRALADLAEHLRRHDVAITAEAVDGGGRPIGDVLADYARDQGADLLVMGAYGHSRLRDFVLGGATKSLLTQPPLPLLLSH